LSWSKTVKATHVSRDIPHIIPAYFLAKEAWLGHVAQNFLKSLGGGVHYHESLPVFIFIVLEIVAYHFYSSMRAIEAGCLLNAALSYHIVLAHWGLITRCAI